MEGIAKIGRYLVRTPLVIAVVTAVAVLGGGMAVFAANGSGSSKTEIFLEPADTLGPNPFADLLRSPVPTVVLARDLLGAPVAGATASLSGGTVGLYGGTLNSSLCDREQMIAFLLQNPSEGRAWASVQGITLEQLPAYVRSLTPVQLRLDTRVTNHGFANGEATALQSVLQAGTAVLVDTKGVPRARCACGNPLLAPQAVSDASYAGTPWTGFDADRLVRVAPNGQPLTTFVLHDAASGTLFERPAGTDGPKDIARIEPAAKKTAPPTTGSTLPTTAQPGSTSVTPTTAAPASSSSSSTSTSSTSSSTTGRPNPTRPPTTVSPTITLAPATTSTTEPPTTAPPTTPSTAPPTTPSTSPPTTPSTAPPTTTTTVKQVAVPALTDRDVNQAQREAKAAGLVTSVTETETRRAKPGTVLSQDPAPRTQVDAGSTVNLVVAVAPALVTVPELVGMTLPDAQATADKLGLVLSATGTLSDNYRCGETFVAVQSPKPGTEVEKGTKITIRYFEGFCPR